MIPISYNFPTGLKNDTYSELQFSLRTVIEETDNGPLTVGAFYVIENIKENDDFTPYGATENKIGHEFQATGAYNWANGSKLSKVEKISLVDATIRMQFYDSTGALAMTKTSSSGLAITSAINGIFKLNSFILTLAAGMYEYDCQVTFSNSVVSTYIKGTFNVLQDKTQSA